MFAGAREHFESLLNSPPWVRSLANILPLSALVDFVNVPAVLHTYQLTGSVPLWCWPATPSGSRLLLAEARTANVCCLDRYGNGRSVPICLDGRFGDMYPMVNAETMRRCVEVSRCVKIQNTHENMLRDNSRVQRLELVHVSRQTHTKANRASWQYWCFSIVGWIVLLGLIVLATILGCWISLAFSLVVLATGILVKARHGRTPRKSSGFQGSAYNRLVVTALHVNETDWQVFYGESTIVNALLNRSLRPPAQQGGKSQAVRMLLSACILGQWVLAIGAAATQDWNSFLVTAWIVFCVFAQSCLFTPAHAARQWMEQAAKIEVKRYQVELSTRRTLLNTIVALNPDTFEAPSLASPQEHSSFRRDGLLWIDPVLKASNDRTEWLEATRIATAEAHGIGAHIPGGDDQYDWRQRFEKAYWFTFILEGIDVARQLKVAANLSGKTVRSVLSIAPTGP